jgi:phosphate starvation-inducible PhoH-like protein
LKRTAKKRVLSFAGVDPVKLLGINDRNIRVIEEHFDQDVVVRGDEIILQGSTKRVEQLTRVIETLIRIAGGGRSVSEGDVITVIRGDEADSRTIEKLGDAVVFYSTQRRRNITPRSIRQKEYVEAIRRYDIVFAIGPAGTGKTYLAIAMALAALKAGSIERIFVSRPVVEAGENLGFLPGDLQEKIDPYLRPIFDAMREMVGMERVQRMIDSGVLEIAPLAYMRGRTLNNSFAILDEAQNSTIMQMKMFLTRLGVNAKAIVTGDITQIDLADERKSGLVAVKSILDGVEGIKFITFGEEDVVRHQLVRRIIRAFSALSARREVQRDDGTETGAGACEPTEDARSSPENSDE